MHCKEQWGLGDYSAEIECSIHEGWIAPPKWTYFQH